MGWGILRHRWIKHKAVTLPLVIHAMMGMTTDHQVLWFNPPELRTWAANCYAGLLVCERGRYQMCSALLALILLRRQVVTLSQWRQQGGLQGHGTDDHKLQILRNDSLVFGHWFADIKVLLAGLCLFIVESHPWHLLSRSLRLQTKANTSMVWGPRSRPALFIGAKLRIKSPSSKPYWLRLMNIQSSRN